MKNHHKLGIAITCTFLCLCGAVIGLKLQDAQVEKKSDTSVADNKDAPTKSATNPPASRSTDDGGSPSPSPTLSLNNGNRKTDKAQNNIDPLEQIEKFGGSSLVKTGPSPAPVSNANTPSNPVSTENKIYTGPSSLNNVQRDPKANPGSKQETAKPFNNDPLGNSAANTNDKLQFQRTTEPNLTSKDGKEKSNSTLLTVSGTSSESNAKSRPVTNNAPNTPAPAMPSLLGPGPATTTNNAQGSPGSSATGQQAVQSTTKPNQTPASTPIVNNATIPTAQPAMPSLQSSSLPPLAPSPAMPGPTGNNVVNNPGSGATPALATPVANPTANTTAGSSQGGSTTKPNLQSPSPSPAFPSMLGGSANPVNDPNPKPIEKDKQTPLPHSAKQTESPLMSSAPLSGPPTAPSMVPIPTASAPPSPAAPVPASSPPAPATSLTPTPATPAPASPAPAAVTPIPTSPAPPSNPPKDSFYIRDAQPVTNPGNSPPSSEKNGPVGGMPPPLPLPTAPVSSSSGSSPEKAVPTSNPVARPQPASGPMVTSYDEQVYECQPGDTFEKISERFYMGTKYAEALKRHNQLHPRSSLTDSGTMTPGAKIFIPQAFVLENHYADAISRPAAAPTSGTVPAVFNPGSSTQQPQR